jgi:uncharacterized protein YjeT (DUF2065 family)
MKKYSALCALIITFSIFFPLFLNADAGPKPSIIITVKNIPENTLCYIDLLVPENSGYTSGKKFDITGYNEDLLKRIAGHGIKGHVPYTTGGKSIMQNEIECSPVNGECRLKYGYMVPDRFYIIAAADNGDTVISGLVEPENFSSRINFDFKTGEALEEKGWFTWVNHFFAASFITLLLEGIILILFRFSLRNNLKLFLSINITTQLLLTCAMALAFQALGIIGAFLILFPLEALVFIIEGILFTLYLKEHSKGRRLVFSITANMTSLAAGTVLLGFIATFL